MIVRMAAKRDQLEAGADVSAEEVALARRYPMVVTWDDAFATYVVSFPDFPGLHGYGATAEIAAAQGAEIIVHLVTGHLDAGRPLPEPSLLVKVA